MELSIQSPTQVTREISVTLTAEEIQPYFEKAYVREAKKIEMPGFRKGKVPLAMVKKMHAEEIEYRELDDIANEYYKKIITENNLHPVGEPVLADIKFNRGESFKFQINAEVLPEFTLSELKGITVQKITHTVTEEEVQNELEYLRRSNAIMTDVEKATDDEHIVTFTIQELDEKGIALIGRKTEPIQVHLTDDAKLQEIREGLKGAEVGKSYKITYTPAQGEEAGTVIDGEFHVTKIQKVQLPELNEELIKKISRLKYSTLEEFTVHLKQDLENYWNERSTRNLEDAIAQEIIKRHDFEVPNTLIKGFGDNLLQEVKEKQPGKVFPRGFDEAKFREENHDYCKWQAKWFLLRERIREEFSLNVEDADYEKIAEEESKKIGIAKERLLMYYKNAKGLSEKILNDKMFSFLIANAIITEKADTEIEEEHTHIHDLPGISA
ncbi:MAG: trigger factor [Bacteroidota bacterium]